jgi:hypothetical protein
VDPAVVSEAVEDPVVLGEAAITEAWRRMQRCENAWRGPDGG